MPCTHNPSGYHGLAYLETVHTQQHNHTTGLTRVMKMCTLNGITREQHSNDKMDLDLPSGTASAKMLKSTVFHTLLFPHPHHFNPIAAPATHSADWAVQIHPPSPVGPQHSICFRPPFSLHQPHHCSCHLFSRLGSSDALALALVLTFTLALAFAYPPRVCRSDGSVYFLFEQVEMFVMAMIWWEMDSATSGTHCGSKQLEILFLSIYVHLNNTV